MQCPISMSELVPDAQLLVLRLPVCSLIVIWSCRSLISCARIWQVATAGRWGETSTPNLTEGFHVCQRRDEINIYLKKKAGISDVVHKPVMSWLSVLPCASSEQFSVNVMWQECAEESVTRAAPCGWFMNCRQRSRREGRSFNIQVIKISVILHVGSI